MTTTLADDPHATNQRELVAALASVRAALSRCAATRSHERSGEAGDVDPLMTQVEPHDSAPNGLPDADSPMPSALRTLRQAFGLALAALPGAHWSALSPTGPLRRWRLIEVGEGPSLVASPLRLDERILHFVAGL